jgi:spore coat polysaccharide biosynthesis protein SpsF (cytidylyltransferase family)
MLDQVALVVCSRPQSSRLPRKVFADVAGVPLLRILDRRTTLTGLRRVLALPFDLGAGDDANYRSLWTGELFYGDSDSPLHRMGRFLDQNPEVLYIVRVTHDDPLIDAEEVARLVSEVRDSGAGYGVTRGLADGMGAEVMCRENILAACLANGPTEFVSYFVRGFGMPNPAVVERTARSSAQSTARLTVDYPEDLLTLSALLGAVGVYAPTEKIVAYLEANPLTFNTLPDLSIYTCAHNASEFVGRAVASAAVAVDELTGLGWGVEYIFVDDASTDETMVRALTAMPRGARVIQNKTNLGLASSSNVAVSAARGKYVMRLDADDELIREEIPKMLAETVEGNFDATYPAYVERPSGEVKMPEDHHAGGAMFKRSLLNELRFRDGLRHWDSLELWSRIAKVPDAAVFTHVSPSWVYNRRAGSMSAPSAERERVKADLGL